MNLEFEWDNQKDSLNLQKHGISFETAKTVLMTPLRTSSMMNGILLGKVGKLSSDMTKKIACYWSVLLKEQRLSGLLAHV
jgi:hypothetical protein